MKILFLTNIPSPYRLDFFNELGQSCDLRVVFEAEKNYQLHEKWYSNKYENFNAVFLKKGEIQERKVNWKILKQLDKKNQDLIVVTNYGYLTELIALLYIKLKKIPYCIEIDGGIIRNDSRILKLLKKFLMKNAKGYISPSNSSDEFLIYYGAKNNKIYRYPFTSIKKDDLLPKLIMINEKIKIRNKLKIKGEKIVLTIGQFINRKGFDILLKSCTKLSKKYGIYIIGGEPTQEYIELKKKLNLDNVHFVGFKSKDELKEYYMAVDLFVLPTREDVWGLVINEAMAYGLPVITTGRCVSGLELVKDYENGFIIPVNDEEQLAEKINMILSNDSLCKSMSEKSLEKIREYTIEKMAERHMEIFEKILIEKTV